MWAERGINLDKFDYTLAQFGEIQYHIALSIDDPGWSLRQFTMNKKDNIASKNGQNNANSSTSDKQQYGKFI